MLVMGFVGGMFGMTILAFIPIPIALKGGLRTNTIMLSDGTDSGTILLTTKPDGDPSIAITGSNSKTAFFLTVSHKGYPSIDISNPDGSPLVSLTTGKQPSIRVYDPNTNTIAWEVVGDVDHPIKTPKP